MNRIAFIPLLGLLAIAGRAAAQTEAAEASPARARITLAGGSEPLVGTITRATPDELAIVRAPGDTARIPRASIARIESSRGMRSNTGRGLRLGAILGGAAGAVLGIAAMSDDTGYLDFGAEAIPAMATGGAILGAAVGAGVGALSRSERWSPAEPDGVELIVSVSATGISGHVRF